MQELFCEHCGCPGAEAGWLGDSHAESIECIEAMRDKLREQERIIQALSDRLALIESRERVDDLPLAA